MSQNSRQVHLATIFPAVNHTTIWSLPDAKSRIDFSTFEQVARTAERGLFDFFFLGEGLRLSELKGEIFDLDIVGRPNTLSALAALAGVTKNLGLAGTLSSTYNEPFELARALGTLDHLSQGRAAWNVVTTNDAFTGENFRRGGFLEYVDRYNRAVDFTQVTRELWDTQPREVVEHASKFFDISTTFPNGNLPQEHPVVLQAGDSDAGREFAVGSADVIFALHSGFEKRKDFYKDVKSRLGRYGRGEDDLKIFTGATVVLGSSEADAQERAWEIRRKQITGPRAIVFLEQVWGRDLTSYDPDGPLPAIEPEVGATSISQGKRGGPKDNQKIARLWRQRAEA